MPDVYMYVDETGNLDYDGGPKRGGSAYFGFGTAIFSDVTATECSTACACAPSSSLLWATQRHVEGKKCTWFEPCIRPTLRSLFMPWGDNSNAELSK